MNEINENEVQEWVIPFYKGGEGSGEHDGHPFRGNGHSGGVPQAARHNPRGDENRGSQYHVHAGNLRTQAGVQALHEGRYGDAMRHFNEAARHGAWAGKKIMGENNRLGHQDAKTTYALTHSAGDKAQLANQSTRTYARLLRQGADPYTLALASAKAQSDVSDALSAGNTAQSHMAGIMNSGMGRAFRGAVPPQAEAAS